MAEGQQLSHNIFIIEYAPVGEIRLLGTYHIILY